MLKKLLYVLLFLFIYSKIATAQNPFLGSNLSAINVDAFTNDQVVKALQEIQKSGYGLSQVQQLAKQKGLPDEQWAKFIERINALSDSSNTVKKGVKSQVLKTDTIDNEERTLAADAENDKQVATSNSVVIGTELFKNKNLTFEPNLKIPTPKNYTLGPDDELVIDIYGEAENSYSLKVSVDGFIRIPLFGPIYVSGLTIEGAKKRITEKLRQGYSSLGGATQVQVTLGQIRSIKLTVIGEATLSGTYTLPSLATLFNALYVSGGPNINGSFRAIELIRNNKVIQKVDLYRFLLYGDQKADIRLEDQDIIRIPTYTTRVTIQGEVKRPGVYEMLPNDKLKDVIAYAGGFSDAAYTAQIKIMRLTTKDQKIINVDNTAIANYAVLNADQITVYRMLDRFENRITINGCVFRPGEYALDAASSTVKQLIQKADGLKEDAFLSRAIIYRVKNDLSKELLSFDLGKLLSGDIDDIPLKKEDILTIYSKFNLQESSSISIYGEVIKPGTYDFVDNMSVEDLIQLAGGLRNGASLEKIQIGRRVDNADPNDENRTITKVFEIDINRNLEFKSGSGRFILEPFDQITIRKSPNYKPQESVTISGEVLYPGQYFIESKTTRISDLIKKSGDLTVDAYAKGAIFIRSSKLGETELKIRKEQLEAIQKIDTNIKQTNTLDKTKDFVTIDLNYILKHPGSSKDVIVQDGDLINIPRYSNVIKTRGELVYQQSIAFNKGKTARYYMRISGGFGLEAYKRKTYVAYQNGEVRTTSYYLLWKSYPKVEPGSEIVVPSKKEKFKEREKTSPVIVAAIITSFSTTALIIANLIK